MSVSSRIKCFEERTSRSRRELSEQQLLEFHRSVVENCNWTFNEKNNEERYKINEQILEFLRDSEEYLNEAVNNSGCVKAEAALNSLVQGINMILYTQTLIKLEDNIEDDQSNPDLSEEANKDAANSDIKEEGEMSRGKTRRLKTRRYAVSTSTQVEAGPDDTPTETTEGQA